MVSRPTQPNKGKGLVIPVVFDLNFLQLGMLRQKARCKANTVVSRAVWSILKATDRWHIPQIILTHHIHKEAKFTSNVSALNLAWLLLTVADLMFS